MVNTITTNCQNPFQVTSVAVLFGSTSYTLANTSPADLPWEITGIQVTFTGPAGSGSAASLSGITATGFSGLATKTVTWTIPATPIANATAVLSGSGPNALTDSSANALNAGAGFSQPLKVLWGDVNGDGIVNASDLVLTNNATAQPYNILYDLNGDGVVNSADVAIVRSRINTRLP
jgi:hypothetical protein